MFTSKNSIIEKQAKRIAELEENLNKIAMGELTISEVIAGNNQMSLNIEGSIMHLLADSFIELFKGNGATNYIESTFADSEDNEEYVITLQKRSGTTPSQKVAQLTELADNMANAQSSEEFLVARKAYFDYLKQSPSGNLPC